uniref:Uncharacterized protein n=1 Tax=Anguilla anguilla TaxID=7936 RepID=A0A0E9Q9V3_ANGAN
MIGEKNAYIHTSMHDPNSKMMMRIVSLHFEVGILFILGRCMHPL